MAQRRCPKCASIWDEKFKFCPEDGARLSVGGIKELGDLGEIAETVRVAPLVIKNAPATGQGQPQAARGTVTPSGVDRVAPTEMLGPDASAVLAAAAQKAARSDAQKDAAEPGDKPAPSKGEDFSTTAWFLKGLTPEDLAVDKSGEVAPHNSDYARKALSQSVRGKLSLNEKPQDNEEW